MNSKPPGPVRILVLDEDENVRAVSVRILTRAGFDVIAAATPEMARSVLKRRGPPIDLLLCDVALADVSVGDATTMRERHPAMKMLFMIGDIEDDLRDQITDAATVFLAKPFDSTELVEAVERALRDEPTSA